MAPPAPSYCHPDYMKGHTHMIAADLIATATANGGVVAGCAAAVAVLEHQTPQLPPVANTKRFAGNFLLFRKSGNGLKRPGNRDQRRPPRFRHPTFEAAEAEAIRLLAQYPESTFVVIQEVGRVKLKPCEAANG